MIRKCCSAILIITSTALLAYCAYRAYHTSLTHDEALSFTIVTYGDSSPWKHNTNNHFLNTFFMKGSSRLFGYSEMALRLPNVLAFVQYLSFIYLILKRLNASVLRLLAFGMMALNPFLIDFFGLARGYGLSLSFMTGSLFFLLKDYETQDANNNLLAIWLYAAFCFSWLAVAANFVLLYYYAALLIIALVTRIHYHKAKAIKLARSYIVSYGALAFLNLMFVSIVTKGIHYAEVGPTLKKEYTFGAWKQMSFWETTVDSLIQSSFYNRCYDHVVANVASLYALICFLVCLFVSLYLIFYKERRGFLVISTVLLSISIIQPIAQHMVLGTPFPIERVALFYIPIFTIAHVFCFDKLLSVLRQNTIRGVFSILLLIVFGLSSYHFCRTVNLHHTVVWFYDSNTRAALDVLNGIYNHHPQKKIYLGVNWAFEPSVNYYGTVYFSDWLVPVARGGPDRGGLYDPTKNVYYCFKGDMKKLLGRDLIAIKEFHDTDTVVLGTRSFVEGIAQ